MENVKSAFAAAQSAYGNVAALNQRIYDSVEKTVEQGAQAAKAAKPRARKR